MDIFEREELYGISTNDTEYFHDTDFPVYYRILATVLHSTIFLLGVVGNAVLVVVILRTKCLQTPTYYYLVSLAVADLLVLLSAVPETIVFHHLGRRWMADQATCSLFIFVNFLGINAGSISILAFSVEIYIAICKPLISRRFCTVTRTYRIILALWLIAILYCSPWLYLTEVKDDPTGRPQCDFRVSKEQYFYYFTADLCFFYLIPLVVALVIYSQIVNVLRKSVSLYKRESSKDMQTPTTHDEPGVEMSSLMSSQDEALYRAVAVCQRRQIAGSILREAEERMRSRTHVLRMLIVIVLLFAVLWLPYRGLLVYNTFLERPWLNLWYLFFAKTMIYLNSAMNPFLYSAMSRRFRKALCATMACRDTKDDRNDHVDNISRFSRNRSSHNNLAVLTNGNNSAAVSQEGIHHADQKTIADRVE